MSTTDKYDRQIRMWGPHGQKKLNKSKIVCLGLSTAGTETLKNLVLPGIGSITIVSDRKVDETELGSNFFVTAQQFGKNLAEVDFYKLERT